MDIGSNSAQLQVVDVIPGAPPLPTHAIKEPTLLAEAMNEHGEIDESGLARLTDAVARGMVAVERLGVGELYIFATSAVRDARNRDEAVRRVEAASGLRLQFLSGEEEARLTYLAVRRWYGWSAGRLLVLDIGGGSMEIVLGRDAEPDFAVSLPLGAGRLTRAYLRGDPPTRKQIKALRKHVRETLSEVIDRLRWEAEPARAIATSKTFKQLARLAGAAPQRKGPFKHRELSVDDLGEWIPRLAKLPSAKRSDLRGISRSRARQIVAGALVAKATMDAGDIPAVELCPWALREGIMLTYLESKAHQSACTTLQTVRPRANGESTPLHVVTEEGG
ncbi:Ppx/GppA family phosphatase [Flindersiella endophytica]